MFPYGHINPISGSQEHNIPEREQWRKHEFTQNKYDPTTLKPAEVSADS